MIATKDRETRQRYVIKDNDTRVPDEVIKLLVKNA